MESIQSERNSLGHAPGTGSLGDWAIPPKLREDPYAARKARLLVRLAIAMILVACGGVVLMYISGTGLGPSALSALTGASLHVLALVILHRTARLDVAVIVFLVALVVSLTIAIVFAGGIGSPVVWWLALPVVLALHLGGRAVGGAVFVMTILVTLGLYLLERAGLSIDVEFQEALPDTWPYFAMVCLYFTAVAAVVWVVERESTRARAAFEEARLRAFAQDRLASLGMMTSGIAHEINNPLAYVRSNFGLLVGELKRSESLEPELEELVSETEGDITDGLRAIGEIVDDLRVFSRRPDAIGEESIEPVDVAGTVDAAIALARPQLSDSMHLHVERGDDVPFALGDGRRLSQVFLNLLINAVHALEEVSGETRIDVRIVAEDDHPAVEISDTGPGIDPDVLDRVFDPFFTTKEPGRGTGLGLSISREIVTRYGGEIEVESTVGEGTTFTVRLARGIRL